MYSFFRNNQKFVMIVMVILMVAFIIPTFFGKQQGGGDFPVGQIGKQKITRDEIGEAEKQWDYLAQGVLVQQRGQDGQPQWVPLGAAALPFVYQQTRQTPELYYLLISEAKKLGFTPSLAQAKALLDSPNVGIRNSDGSVVDIKRIDEINEPLGNYTRYCVANLDMVLRAFNRAMDTLKVSQPLAEHVVAEMSQQVTLQMVDFAAKDYEAKVAEPTAEQLQTQFNQFKGFEANLPTDTNPFGFGYKYPNRVKLQYVGVPREQVRKAVYDSKGSTPEQREYNWSVEAAKYYSKHLDEFAAAPTSQPTTGPTTKDSFSLGDSSKSKTGPTTKPFEEVRQTALNAVIDPMVDKLQRQIVSDIKSELTTAHRNYEGSAGPAATQPAAIAAAPTGSYANYDFLKALADHMERKYHVTLTIGSATDRLRSSKELRELPGIGTVSQFPDQATQLVDAFSPEPREGMVALRVMEMSRPIWTSLDSGDAYFYRITEAQPAHEPATLDEVKDQVTSDWKRAQAFELAKADAKTLLETANTQGLDAAAAGAGKKVITTGAFAVTAGSSPPQYTVSSRAQSYLNRAVRELVGALAANKADSSKRPPVRVIELPPDAKVAVGELIRVESILNSPRMVQAGVDFYTQRWMAEARQQLAPAWFDYNAVVDRVGYQDLTGASKSRGAKGPVIPTAPLPGSEPRPSL